MSFPGVPCAGTLKTTKGWDMQVYDFSAPRGALALAAVAMAVATMGVLVVLPATMEQNSAERIYAQDPQSPVLSSARPATAPADLASPALRCHDENAA